MRQGKVHLYTGNGKGKTTAALGLIMRACGASMKTYMAQFMKTGDYSEIRALERFGELVRIEQNGPGEFYNLSTSDYIVHRGYAKKGYDAALSALQSKDYDLVVLDEIIGACAFNLVTYDELLALIEAKPGSVELVLTGREAPTDLYDRCDLVTEMKEIKHYYNEGTKARKGIEY